MLNFQWSKKRVRKVAFKGSVSILCVVLVFGTILTISARDFIGSSIGPYLMVARLAMSSTTVVLSHVKGLHIREHGTDKYQRMGKRCDENSATEQSTKFSLIKALLLHGQITLGTIAVHEFWMALILSLPELLHAEAVIYSVSRITSVL